MTEYQKQKKRRLDHAVRIAGYFPGAKAAVMWTEFFISAPENEKGIDAWRAMAHKENFLDRLILGMEKVFLEECESNPVMQRSLETALVIAAMFKSQEFKKYLAGKLGLI